MSNRRFRIYIGATMTKQKPLLKVQRDAKDKKLLSGMQEKGDSSTYLQAFGNSEVDRPRPIPEGKALEKLGEELLQWARIDMNAIKVRKFFRAKNYDHNDITNMLASSIVFKRYYYMALDEIGDRRETMGFEKKASEKIVCFTMPLYDPDWKARQVEESLLKQQQLGKDTGNIIVHMAPIPAVASIEPIDVQPDSKD